MTTAVTRPYTVTARIDTPDSPRPDRYTGHRSGRPPDLRLAFPRQLTAVVRLVSTPATIHRRGR